MESEKINHLTGIIYGQLRTIVDPEYLVNIVDLGLIYEVKVLSNNKTIIVRYTLTSQYQSDMDQSGRKIIMLLKQFHPDYKILAELVWSPEWSPDFVNEEEFYSFTI